MGEYLYEYSKESNGAIKIQKKYETGVLVFYNNMQMSAQGINYNINDEDIADVKIQHCISGRCKKTVGYIKYDYSTVYKCGNTCEVIDNDEIYNEISKSSDSEIYLDSTMELYISSENGYVIGLSELSK